MLELGTPFSVEVVCASFAKSFLSWLVVVLNVARGVWRLALVAGGREGSNTAALPSDRRPPNFQQKEGERERERERERESSEGR